MKRTRVALVMPFLAVLGAACGQVGGVHGAPGAPLAAGAPANASSSGYADSGALHGIAVHVKSFGGNSTKGHDRITVRRVGNKVITTKRVRIGNKIITTVKTTTNAVAAQSLTPAVLNQRGPLYVCPVQGRFSVGDDFGAPRRS